MRITTMVLASCALAFCAHAKGTSDVLPEGLSVGVYARMHSGDPGIQWILDSYKHLFLSEHASGNSKAVVEDFSVLELDEISAGFYDALGKKPKMLLVGDILATDASVTFKVKNVDFKLNIKERSQEKGLQPAVVKALLGQWVSAADRAVLPGDLTYSASFEQRGKVCAYAVHKDRVIVSNQLVLAQDALRSTMQGAAVPMPPELKEFLGRFQKPQDFFIYLNNAQGFLDRLNAMLEKRLKIPLLTGAASIRCAGIFADIVSKDHIELRGIFLVDDPQAITTSMQDIGFLVEFFRRKLLREGIATAIHLDQSPGKIQVHMGLSNTEAFLMKYLKKGRIKKRQSSG